MDSGKRDLASVKYRRRIGGAGAILVVLVTVVVLVWGIWAASARAAPRPVAPETVVPVEWYDAMWERHKATLDEDGRVLQIVGVWADSDRAVVTAAALLGTMDPVSLATWRPGYEEFLRAHELSDSQIRAAVFAAYAQQAVEIADAVFVELGKPGP